MKGAAMAGVLCACTVAVSAVQSGGPVGGARNFSSATDLLRSLPFRFIGPTGNRVVAVAGVPGDPSVIYAGAASGGLFKTNDAGLHWAPLFDHLNVASIGAIAVAKSDPNIVWVGTGEVFIRGNVSIGNGIYKSVDAGKTWTHMGLENTGRIARVVIDPVNPDIVSVAALGHCYGPQPERGVFRTIDGGRKWDRVLFVDENSGAVDLVMDPSNPKTLFAATWQFTIYPWYAESGGPGSRIHVSRDGGTTWTALSGDGLPPPPLGRIGLGIAPSNPKRIYATIETADQGTLWRSDDGGGTWQRVSSDRGINNRARYFSRLGVVADNPDEVYFLTQRLMRSTDGGKTTTVVPEVYPDQHDIWIDPLNANRQIVANDRYVNISMNRGRSWFRAGLPIAQIYRVATDSQVPYNVFGARQDGPTYRGPSNSLLTTGQIPADLWEYAGWNESGYAIPDRDEQHVLWVSDNRHVERYNTRVRSTRDANPWAAGREPATSGSAAGAGQAPPAQTGRGGRGRGGGRSERQFRINWTAPLALSPHDPDTAYAGSQYVHRTTDDGRTWTIISPDLTTNDVSKYGQLPGLGPDGQDVYSVLFAIAESPVTAGLIWTGSNDGQVYLTRDAGKNWSNVTANISSLPPAGTVSSIEPSKYAEGTTYITVDRHRANDSAPYIFKTSDFGKTWRAITSGIPKSVFSYVRVIREDPRRQGLLYAGTENALYVSFDDGASWLPMRNNLPPAAISWMVVQEDFNDLVISTYGRGFWIFDDLTPLQQLTTKVLQSKSYLFEPRPAYVFRVGDPLVGNNMAVEFDPSADVGANPPPGASINYYLSAPAAGDVQIAILNGAGAAIRTLKGPNEPGINRVWWDLRDQASAASNRGMGFGAPGRDNPYVAPGTYTVKLTVGGQEHVTKLMLRKDPNSEWQ
jgi:photosystem II stability/assembly factor-like uncharacterized protein